MNDFRQYSYNQEKSSLRLNENENSLIDILRFLKDAYKTILVSGVLGIALSIAYIAITPKQYEASVQIVMAQIRATNISNTIGVNIEKSVHLIARTSSPTSFTRMIAPIYANDTPTAPRKHMILTTGLFDDLFLELLIALDRQLVFKLKSTAGGAL
jgi:uncharacterized protein involved in exopolysaccharide biosynthesis